MVQIKQLFMVYLFKYIIKMPLFFFALKWYNNIKK